MEKSNRKRKAEYNVNTDAKASNIISFIFLFFIITSYLIEPNIEHKDKYIDDNIIIFNLMDREFMKRINQANAL